MELNATEAELAAGRGYEELFVPSVFSRWTSHVLDAAGIGEGAHVLDVACGTGILARHALKRSGPSGRIVGLDMAPGMLAAAAEAEPEVEWVRGRAEDLPFEPGTFDAVLCQFAMMFFEDRARAAREMARVTKPGGSVALAVWNAIDRNPAYGQLATVLDALVGTEAGDAVRVPFRLGDPAVVSDDLSGAGLTDVRVETGSEQASFPSARTMVEAELRGWLPLCGITLPEETIAEVMAGAERRLSAYTAASGRAEFPTSAHIVAARRPA